MKASPQDQSTTGGLNLNENNIELANEVSLKMLLVGGGTVSFIQELERIRRV